ncbi:MAG: 5'-methylthioadenosine/adenosylhomocysteine nucleosidase [Clostridia bacterium]|nr:5'-methylthioadenosine/adenosylhomocysteine nucleosidase [Clostridia bacterium]
MKRVKGCMVISIVVCLLLCWTGFAEDSRYVGIISAMQNEIDLLLSEAEIDHIDTIGGVDFNVGTIDGKPVVIAKAGIGKSLSAAGTAAMLNRYDISKVLFTGVAGGVGDETSVLDVVVATKLVQHDYGMLTNDGFEWFEDSGYYACDGELVDLAYDAAVSVVGEEHAFKGIIASGDQFVASEDYVKRLQADYDAVACEMEGASVALVCQQYGIPFVVIRTMSDKADGKAQATYEDMADTAANHSNRIVLEMMKSIGGDPVIRDDGDTQYVLYLGTNDKDTNKPVFTQSEAMEKAKEILIRHFGGYTLQEAHGGWMDEGTLYQEYTLVIYLSDTTEDAVHTAADELVEAFHQSSVLIQANPTKTEFYAGKS